VPALACPACAGSLATDESGLRCAGCGAVYPVVGGIASFLGAAPGGVEDDFLWDYNADPRISPLTLARWAVMTRLLDDVDVGPVVVAVGGGGEHWPARRLDGRVKEYVVVDTSLRQLERQWFPAGASGTALLAAGERLPLADRSADTMELWGVLDHFVDPAAAIAEAARVVRPGGNLLVGLGNDGSWYRRLAGRFAPSDSDAHHNRFDLAAISALLGEAFALTRARTVGYLRLPVKVERMIGRRMGAAARERLVEESDRALRRLLGPHAGGMLLVEARRAEDVRP
jgi:SAM-dependent methyltransferase